MNFLGMGPGELMLIMILALIVFGPQKLPEIAQGIGKAVGEFRRATSQITDEINREISLETPPKPQTPPAPAAPQPAAPVENPTAGQTQNEPMVLEIKPPTTSTTSEATQVNEAPPMVPEEVISESPSVHTAAEEAVVEAPVEAPVETNGTAADLPAKPTRTRRIRKPVAEPAEPEAEVAPAEVIPTPRPVRRRKAAVSESTEEPRTE